MSNDYAFLSKSAAETKAKSGKTATVPLGQVEVSHKSHPFYTGSAIRRPGRIDKFIKYGKFDKKQDKDDLPFAKKARNSGLFLCPSLRISALAECAQW